MKKFFEVMAVISILILVGCKEQVNYTYDDLTTLTIKNLSDYSDMEVSYGNIPFGVLASGKENTNYVDNGTKYININYYFDFFGNGITYSVYLFRVNEAVTCEKGEKNQFIITNNTVIVNSDKTGTLKDIIESVYEQGERR
jgi:hypothetical protein